MRRLKKVIVSGLVGLVVFFFIGFGVFVISPVSAQYENPGFREYLDWIRGVSPPVVEEKISGWQFEEYPYRVELMPEYAEGVVEINYNYLIVSPSEEPLSRFGDRILLEYLVISEKEIDGYWLSCILKDESGEWLPASIYTSGFGADNVGRKESRGQIMFAPPNGGDVLWDPYPASIELVLEEIWFS